MFSYEGKKALVTGGGRGIGRAIALAFARQGADIAIVARSQDELDGVAREIEDVGRNAVTLRIDMGRTDQVGEMVNKAARELGGLDVLVNNAGGMVDLPGSHGQLSETTIDAFDAMYAVNVRSPLFAAMAACKVMSKQGRGGAILNIVSIDAVFPAPTEGIYGSAKAALANLTKVLGYEAGKDRIAGSAGAPGVIETPLTESGWPEMSSKGGPGVVLPDQPRPVYRTTSPLRGLSVLG